MEIPACVLFCGLAVLLCTAQKSRSASDSYTAAVVEYAPFEMKPERQEDPALLIRKNAINHMYYIEKAAAQGADIVVFPECGLTGSNLPTSREELRPYLTEIPDPKDQVNPCMNTTGNTSQLLKDLSCTSRRHGIYSVMNLPELSPCASQDGVTEACPHDGAFIYNTNIVFDRQGTLVARYRKYNLFLEPGFDIELTAGHSTFDTDFGVRFGMFICFDVMFRQPAVAMVTEQNITDVIFSTAWFSELPFLTAVQTQAAWAYSMDTNFLASGYNNPAAKKTGSGIFAGRDGVVKSVMAFDELNQMIVAKLKKKSRLNSEDNTLAIEVRRIKRGYDEEHKDIPFFEEVSGQKGLCSGSLLKQKLKEKNAEKKLVPGECLEECRECNNVKLVKEKRNIVKRNAKNIDDLQNGDITTLKKQRKFSFEINSFNTVLLDLRKVDTDGDHNKSMFLCHLSLCCNFTMSTKKVQQSNQDDDANMAAQQFYRVGVFDGRKLKDYQTCLIMRCAGPDLEACKEEIDYSKSQTPSLIFLEIVIDGNFRGNGRINERNNHIVSSNYSLSDNDRRIIMRNEHQIENFTTFSLLIDSFLKEENIDVVNHLNLFQEDLRRYNTILLGQENLNKTLNICQGSLCCEFFIWAESENNSADDGTLVRNAKLTSSIGYFYRIGVFEGVRDFVGTRTAGLQVCALFSCIGENINTCGLLRNETSGRGTIKMAESSTVQPATGVGAGEEINASLLEDSLAIRKIEIKGHFKEGNLVMPTTVTTRLVPLKARDFEFRTKIEQRLDTENDVTWVTMKSTNRSLGDILTFGIYARDFSKDDD